MSKEIIGTNGTILKAGDRVFVYDLDSQYNQTKVYGLLCYDTAKNQWSIKYDDGIECIVLYNEGVNKCDKTYRSTITNSNLGSIHWFRFLLAAIRDAGHYQAEKGLKYGEMIERYAQEIIDNQDKIKFNQ